MFVGPAFFQGFVNSRYLGKIKAKLMFCEAQAVKLESKQLFQAFHHWINDPELLDPKVHVPSLPKNMFPNYLSRLVDHTEQHHEENQVISSYQFVGQSNHFECVCLDLLCRLSGWILCPV